MSQANTNRSSNGRPGGPAATRAEATPPSLEAALQIVFEDKDRGFALPIGVKKLTSRIKERFPGLEAVGVKVACKEVKLALEGNSSRIRLLAERALKIQRQAAEAQRFEAALAAENEAWAREAARRIEFARAEEAARQRRAEYEARQARAAEEARQRRADRVNHYEVGSAPGVLLRPPMLHIGQPWLLAPPHQGRGRQERRRGPTSAGTCRHPHRPWHANTVWHGQSPIVLTLLPSLPRCAHRCWA